MRNLLIIVAALTVLYACQKDNLSDDHKLSESCENSNNSATELDTRASDHSVSGKVWEDLDGDGIQDFREPGLEGVTLLLKSTLDNSINQEYLTDVTGEYFFDIEIEGEYYIEIELSIVLNNYVATIPDVIEFEGIDSDLTEEFGMYTSSSFDHDYNDKFDFGFYKGGAIGNMVWYDEVGYLPNIFDGQDKGIQGCILRLYKFNAITGTETLLDSTISDKNGQYLFKNLQNGSYIIEIEILSDNLQSPKPYTFVLANIGSDEKRDSDIVERMFNTGNRLVGRTGYISINSDEINIETDIGLSLATYFHPSPTFSTEGGSVAASPNGTVWIDSNADGFLKGNEPTMEGVTVNLLNSENDSIIQTVVTDNNGYYEFDRINNRIANCYLQISQPRGYMLTKNVSGSCYPTNDFDQKTRKTAAFRTSACPYYSSYDAGLAEGIFMLGRKE